MLSTTFISNNLKSLDIKDIDLKMAQGTKENDDERSFKALMGKKPFKILLLGDTYVGNGYFVPVGLIISIAASEVEIEAGLPLGRKPSEARVSSQR